MMTTASASNRLPDLPQIPHARMSECPDAERTEGKNTQLIQIQAQQSVGIWRKRATEKRGGRRREDYRVDEEINQIKNRECKIGAMKQLQAEG